MDRDEGRRVRPARILSDRVEGGLVAFVRFDGTLCTATCPAYEVEGHGATDADALASLAAAVEAILDGSEPDIRRAVYSTRVMRPRHG